MEINRGTQNKLIITYVILLIVAFTYISSVLSTEKVTIAEKKPKEKVVETKSYKVMLTVENGRSSETYSAKIKSTSTVLDLIDEIRVNDGLSYEKTDYVSGTQIDEVGGLRSQNGFSWRVFLGDKDITEDADRIAIEENQEYTLKFVRD